jgi:hypothetical protein
MKKRPPEAFTAEFKALALLRVKDGEPLPAVRR